MPRFTHAITQNAEAYEYLSRSSRGFHAADRMEHMMQEAGFEATGYKTYMFGIMPLHWAQTHECVSSQQPKSFVISKCLLLNRQ